MSSDLPTSDKVWVLFNRVAIKDRRHLGSAHMSPQSLCLRGSHCAFINVEQISSWSCTTFSGRYLILLNDWYQCQYCRLYKKAWRGYWRHVGMAASPHNFPKTSEVHGFVLCYWWGRHCAHYNYKPGWMNVGGGGTMIRQTLLLLGYRRVGVFTAKPGTHRASSISILKYTLRWQIVLAYFDVKTHTGWQVCDCVLLAVILLKMSPGTFALLHPQFGWFGLLLLSLHLKFVANFLVCEPVHLLAGFFTVDHLVAEKCTLFDHVTDKEPQIIRLNCLLRSPFYRQSIFFQLLSLHR